MLFRSNNSEIDRIERDFQQTLAKCHKVTLIEVKNRSLLKMCIRDSLDGESASIANQRDMLEKYCEKQGWEVVAVYQDDGYTGLNMAVSYTHLDVYKRQAYHRHPDMGACAGITQTAQASEPL